jgi:hypothetical protein
MRFMMSGLPATRRTLFRAVPFSFRRIAPYQSGRIPLALMAPDFVNDLFQFRVRFGAATSLENAFISGWPIAASTFANTAANGLEDVTR